LGRRRNNKNLINPREGKQRETEQRTIVVKREYSSQSGSRAKNTCPVSLSIKLQY
jgi:hypothetical protein